MKLFCILLLILSSFSVQARTSVLDQLGFGSSEEPLPVDEAFKFSVDVINTDTLLAGWRIVEGNYLYKNKIHFELTDSQGVVLGDYVLPQGENKKDEYFGLTEVYFRDLQIDLPLIRYDKTQQITLQATYQGCSETFNICYPPEQKTIAIELESYPAENASVSSPDAAVLIDSPKQTLNTQDQITRSLAEDNLPTILLSFLGLGLLLAFTPCVFPMIPILSSLIVGEGENVTSRRAFVLSLVYVLAMSVTYTLAGVLTGLLGGNLQAMLQNVWVIGSFSLILVLLALSMFGFYELQLPHALQQRLHQISHKQRGGKLISVALMGLLSGLIVGPCLAPPLAGALLFISQHADPILGGAALFAMSIGMGIPLLIIGTSAGTLLPRAGSWMDSIKAVFGVLLIALAIWMLERVLSDALGLALWGSLLVISAIYLGALNSLGIDATGWQKFWKGCGLILLLSGFLILIGAASGGQSLWQPLQHFKGSSAEQSTQVELSFIKVESMAEIEQQIALSTQPVLLDFYADWCTDCKTMEKTTFRDPAVQATLNNFTLLKLDMTDNTNAHKAVLKKLRVFGPPTMVFFTANGEEYEGQRLVGHVSAEEMIANLAQLK